MKNFWNLPTIPSEEQGEDTTQKNDFKFAVFTPIEQPDKVLSYYKQNNIPLPDNEYFDRLFVEPYLKDEKAINELLNSVPDKKEVERNSLNQYIQKSSRMSPITRAVNSINPNIVYNNTGGDPVSEAIENLDNVSWAQKQQLKAHPIAVEIRNLSLSDEEKKYITSLSFYESSFNPKATDTKKYKGLFQFGDDALKDIGFTNEELLKDTTNQYVAALRYGELNLERLKPIVDRYAGAVKEGIKITESGIKAAAHLLGAGTVKDWFYGTKNTKIAKNGFVDGNGTHITKYLERFSK